MKKILISPYLIAIIMLCVLNVLQYASMRRKGNKDKYLALISLLALFALISLSTPLISSALSSSLDIAGAYDDPCPAGIVEVLSGGYSKSDVSGENTLSGETAIRVIKGVEVFKKCDADTIIMSGWSPNGARGIECELMRDLAITMGVPKDKVVIESDSRNTRDHAVNLYYNKNIRIADGVAIVTSPWHLNRALREFRRYFHNVKPVAAYDTRSSSKLHVAQLLPQIGALNGSVTILQEYIGIVWYKLLNRWSLLSEGGV